MWRLHDRLSGAFKPIDVKGFNRVLAFLICGLFHIGYFWVPLNEGTVFTPGVSCVDKIFQNKLCLIGIEAMRLLRLVCCKSLNGSRGMARRSSRPDFPDISPLTVRTGVAVQEERKRAKHTIKIVRSTDISSPPIEMDYSLTTLLVSVPIFSISTLTTSPSLRNNGGWRVKPTPSGVPVRITVPGNSVIERLRLLMMV